MNEEQYLYSDKTSYQIRMDLKKGKEQGRDEKTQQHDPSTK